MDTNDITSWVDSNLPETILLLGGVLIVAIALSYATNRESLKYKFVTFLGLIFGAVMAYEAITLYGEWRLVTSVIVAVAAFALMIRPFRDVHFAAILSLLVMVIIYIALGELAGVMLFDNIDLTVLSEGWPRLIIAFIFGAIVYMFTNFAEEIVKLFGKFLNFWPVLLVLGLVCIVESVFMFMGYGSIADYIDTSQLALYLKL
ncbi:MAG: hypothetical protein IJ026_07430 [Candidatus Methanomethylophilaceae archaeon]|nr:hypothetical protein [Candidatus Methanomethylophilaceae archaeon]